MLESLEEDIVTDDVLDEDLINDDFVAEDEAEDLDDEIEALDEDDSELEASDEECEDEKCEATDDEDEDDIEASLFASEDVPGIEDDIEDTAKGGDPTVQEVVDQGSAAKKEISTDAEVFPTNSEYVASIVTRLDKIASYLEKTGRKTLAYRIDRVSDKLETTIKN